MIDPGPAERLKKYLLLTHHSRIGRLVTSKWPRASFIRTVRIRQFRDKMARIDLRYVRAETEGFAKFLLDHDVKLGIRKAAKTFKAMGASAAEIKAVLPAFGRHGVDVAKAWK